MSDLAEEGGELSKLSAADLAQAYVESVQATEATEHIGRKNRLARRQWQIVQELNGRPEGRSVLQRLAGHSDEAVRKGATSSLAWLDKPTPQPEPEQPKGRFWQNVIWQCEHAPPPAMARDEIAKRLRQSLPEFCDRLMDLALPAIGLWPQRRAEVGPAVSRFGGVPLAPQGWQWPVAEEEPRLFVGQINCAEMRGLPGAEQLPASGLLAFFGDHDAVTGCFPFDSDCVFYWPDVDGLVQAKAPIEPIETFPVCAIVPRPVLDLPYPDSTAVGGFGLNKQQREAYFDIWLDVRHHGIPSDCASYASFSKIFLAGPLWCKTSWECSNYTPSRGSFCRSTHIATVKRIMAGDRAVRCSMCSPMRIYGRMSLRAANWKVSSHKAGVRWPSKTSTARGPHPHSASARS